MGDTEVGSSSSEQQLGGRGERKALNFLYLKINPPQCFLSYLDLDTGFTN